MKFDPLIKGSVKLASDSPRRHLVQCLWYLCCPNCFQSQFSQIYCTWCLPFSNYILHIATRVQKVDNFQSFTRLPTYTRQICKTTIWHLPSQCAMVPNLQSLVIALNVSYVVQYSVLLSVPRCTVYCDTSLEIPKSQHTYIQCETVASSSVCAAWW